MSGTTPSLREFEGLFEPEGTDLPYLRWHWPRLRHTAETFAAGWQGPRPARVLDVGAHWLQQSLLFALQGHQVTALDIPSMMTLPPVQALAARHGMRLLPCADLAAAAELEALPEDSFEVILFCEVLEHLAFNPLQLWRSLYRLLAPGGRIVLTTPNPYALTRQNLRRLRVLVGGGSGIEVDEILRTPTYGHHWKEYSRRELQQYFRLLSPDFVIARSLRVEDGLHAPGSTLSAALAGLRRLLPAVRGRLHLEIDLPRKQHGIALRADWQTR